MIADQAAVTAPKPQTNTARQAEASKRAREASAEAVWCVLLCVLLKRGGALDKSGGSNDEADCSGDKTG